MEIQYGEDVDVLRTPALSVFGATWWSKIYFQRNLSYNFHL